MPLLPYFVVLQLTNVGDPEIVDRTQADRARIQAHLARVETELRARDVSQLSPEHRRARTENLDRLRAYRHAGRFPQNMEFIGQRVPFFIDADGTACAVGHLVIESGAMQVAQEIRANENNAWLGEMRHPALAGWIAKSGLTPGEHAMIQPSYCGCGDEYAPVCGVDGKTYQNACYAETCAMVEVDHEGPCRADGTSGWPPAGTSTSAGESTSGTTGSDSSSTSSEGAATTAGSSGLDDASSTTTTSANEDDAENDEGTVSRRGCRVGSPGWLALLLLLPAAVRRRR